MGKENKSEKEQILEFLLLCLRNWYYFVISMVICAAVAVVYLKVKTPVMKTTTKVSLRSDDSLLGGSITKSQSIISSLSKSSSGDNIEDEAIKIVSQGYVKKVIKNLDLNKIYKQSKFLGIVKKDLYDQSPIVLSVEPELSDTTGLIDFYLNTDKDKTQVKIKYPDKTVEKYEILSFPAILETPRGKFTFSKSAYFEDYKKPFKLKVSLTNYDFMAQIYRAFLEADFLKKSSDIIDIDVTNENIFLAKKLLNEVIHVYNQEWIDDKYEVSKKAEFFIENKLNLVKLNLTQIDKDIQVFKDKYSLTNMEADVRYYFSMSAELQAKLVEAGTQLKLVDIISDYVNDDNKKYELIPFGIAALDPSMADVISKYNEELVMRSEFYRKSGIKTSAMSSLDEQLEMQRKNLLLSLSNIKKGMQISASDLKKKESEFESRLGDIPVIERDYIGMRREQEIQQTVYTFLLEKSYETELKSISLMPKLKIVDEPYVLLKPVSPSSMKVALVTLFFGGVFFPFSAMYLMPYVRNYMKQRKKERKKKYSA
jgi:uncharacterized protein involved in exopolysaccharide biosynthesis